MRDLQVLRHLLQVTSSTIDSSLALRYCKSAVICHVCWNEQLSSLGHALVRLFDIEVI
jgi:hypothetical protein